MVPTSCLVNWESEFKRWCPAFKVLTYYGSAQQRKNLRQGWTKPNAFHVVITSYQLVVQDASSFKRKRWFFLILDEVSPCALGALLLSSGTRVGCLDGMLGVTWSTDPTDLPTPSAHAHHRPTTSRTSSRSAGRRF